MAFLVNRYDGVYYLVDKTRNKPKWIKLGRIKPKEAQKVLARYHTDETYLRIGYLGDSEINFKDLVTEYLQDSKNHKAPYTIEVEKTMLASIEKVFGKKKARDITAKEVEALLHSSKYKPTTIKNKIIIMRNVWNYGVREGYFKENEMKKCRKPELEQLPPVVVSEKAINSIIDNATPTIRIILNILRYTACRPSEALKLQASDIDLNNMTILFRHTKTKRSRYAPISKKLPPSLLEALKNKNGEQLLFPHHDKRSLRYGLEQAKIKAEIKERVFLYAFRHFALTKFLEVTNGDLRGAQQLAGHSQIQTTIRYTHRPHKVIKKAVDKL